MQLHILYHFTFCLDRESHSEIFELFRYLKWAIHYPGHNLLSCMCLRTLNKYRNSILIGQIWKLKVDKLKYQQHSNNFSICKLHILSITPFYNRCKQVNSTVCPGSSDPTLNIESNYFIQLNSCDLKLFCSVNE